MSFFFFFLSHAEFENMREEQLLSGEGGTVGGERRWEKGKGGWIWCNCCVHMYVNGKMITVETIPGMGE
jgi:hypothetical protein